MFRLFALPLILILGFRTFSKASNYPYLLYGCLFLSFLTRFFPNNLLINLGSVAIFHNDLTIFFLLITMFAHPDEFSFKKKNINIIIALTFVIIFFNFASGLIDFGLNNSLVQDIRKFVYHIILIVFATTSDVKIDTYTVLKWAKRFAYAAVLYIYIGTFLHYTFGIQLGAYDDERPLVVHYAILLVVFILYEVYEQLYIYKYPCIAPHTIFAIIAVIINRYNTTWVALFVGIIVLMIFLPEKRRLLNPYFITLVIAIIVAVIVAMLLFANTSVMSAILTTSEKFENLGKSESTFGTRLELWGGLLATLDKKTIWTGVSMGSGYGISYRGTIWQYDPHNGYVETIMRMGIIGCVLLLISYVYAIRKSLKNGFQVGAAIVAAMAFYFIAYTYEFELSFILGYIIALNMNKESGEEKYYGC